MFITVGIVTTLALAGYFGYKNKGQVFWNGLQLYNSIKDYCSQFNCNFKLDKIIVYNGTYYLPVRPKSWRKLSIILLGLCNKDDPKAKTIKIGVSYILNDNKYCKIFSLCNNNHKEAEVVIKYIESLEELNKNKIHPFQLPINYILSASYFNGTEDINITELLQMFDTTGSFYETNEKLSFNNILKWNNKLKLYKLCNKVIEAQESCNTEDSDNYLEIINIYGDIKKFKVDEVIVF